MPHVFNLRKDPTDRRDHVALRALVQLPPAANLASNLGPVRDQGAAGSCTGQAGAGLMDWFYRTFHGYYTHKLAAGVAFSALFLYAEERISDGSFPADNGSDSRTIMQVLQQVGICLNADDPYSDTAIGQQPTAAMVTAASPYRIGAYQRVMFDTELTSMRLVLASGYCCTIGIPVYDEIESDAVAATGILPLPDAGDTPIGGHELLVWGYDDAKQQLRVRNSWGAAWGLSGNLMIPYAYFAAAGSNDTCDSWVAHVGKP